MPAHRGDPAIYRGGRRVANAALARDRDPGDCLAPDRDPGRRADGEYDADVRAAAAFGLAGTGAPRLYVLSGDKRRLPAAILPLGGAIAALHVLFRNLIPAPAFLCSLLPYLVGGWLVLGLAVAAAMPQLRRRVSEGLARS